MMFPELKVKNIVILIVQKKQLENMTVSVKVILGLRILSVQLQVWKLSNVVNTMVCMVQQLGH